MTPVGHTGWPQRLRYHDFSVPRQGCSKADCLDAAAGDPERGCFAIADGASEGGPSPACGPACSWMTSFGLMRRSSRGRWRCRRLQARWRTRVGLSPRPAETPWYVAEHARALDNGAFATFLGLRLEPAVSPGMPWRWQALAVGDTCLFQIRSGVLIETFPLAAPGEFNTTPWLVGSDTSPEEIQRQRSRACDGECWPNDRIWLMTDALAEWFLVRHMHAEKPWEELQAFLDPLIHEDAFGEWIDELRRNGQLRNDDVTLAAVWLE